jgi:hypothetical protein
MPNFVDSNKIFVAVLVVLLGMCVYSTFIEKEGIYATTPSGKNGSSSMNNN